MEFLIVLAVIAFFISCIAKSEKVEPKTIAKHYKNGYELNSASKSLTEEGWNVDSVTIGDDGHIIVIYKSTQ